MPEVKCYAPERVEDNLLLFVVAAARFKDKWVFSRHRKRSTWDMPGGHREPGERIWDAMKRELWEETGATEAEIQPVYAYSVTQGCETSYGMLFYTRIHEMGPLPGEYEMAEILLTDCLPENLTYPHIQPQLFAWIQQWLNSRKNPDGTQVLTLGQT